MNIYKYIYRSFSSIHALLLSKVLVSDKRLLSSHYLLTLSLSLPATTKNQKGILFGLCYFHAIMCERRQYGALGFNASYPFSNGDLVQSASLIDRMLEDIPPTAPWEVHVYMSLIY
jgi:hypothetical protein